MRFTTLPQVLAYHRSLQYGHRAGSKADVIGAFLESNSLADLYEATVQADVIRPEHHLELPFLVHTPEQASAETPADDGDDAQRAALVRALARAGVLTTPAHTYRVLSWDVPLRGLLSATGSTRHTPRADLVVGTSDAEADAPLLGVAAVRVGTCHPLIAAIEALHHLAHLNKPRIRDRILAEIEARWPGRYAGAPFAAALVVAPAAYYAHARERDTVRRSGKTNADVVARAVAQLAEVGITLRLLAVEGDWKAGLFVVRQADYGAHTGQTP